MTNKTMFLIMCSFEPGITVNANHQHSNGKYGSLPSGQWRIESCAEISGLIKLVYHTPGTAELFVVSPRSFRTGSIINPTKEIKAIQKLKNCP